MASVATVHAQELSGDGNRWYDVEVSVFTNEVPGGTRSEIPVARKLTAAYLPRLRELTSRSSAFVIEFPEDRLPMDPAVVPPLALPATPDVPSLVMGPVYSPALRDSFKIIDFDRDSFVDLGTRASRFDSMLRSIEAAPEHRLLWHKVWRQPMLGRAQSSAVFVSGGDMHAGHNELEGSLRLVDNAGGAMLDINIWLNEFRPGIPGVITAEAATEVWKIPAHPFPPVGTTPPSEAAPWDLAAVWQLAQTRELGANQLYYLDHPAIGVLIEVRPYLLPPRLVDMEQSDF